jgi:hypothetical protein
MLTVFLSYLPIVVGPIAAIALGVGLQHLLKRSRSRSATATRSTATDLVPATQSAHPKLTWSDIAARSSPLVAYVLPVVTSLSIVLLGLWPFAYLGWAVIRVDPDPGWGVQTPPWFGNLGYFLGYGFAGLVLAILGVAVGAVLAVGLHAIGKCILWPEVCGCGDEPPPVPGDANQDGG